MPNAPDFLNRSKFPSFINGNNRGVASEIAAILWKIQPNSRIVFKDVTSGPLWSICILDHVGDTGLKYTI